MSIKNYKKIMLGTSDAWSRSHLSKRTSKLAYYIVDCRIFNIDYNIPIYSTSNFKIDPSQMISTHCDQCWKLFLLKVSDAAASASWPISWWIRYWKLAVKKWWFFFSASYTKRILFLWSYKGNFSNTCKGQLCIFFWKI